MNPTLLVILCIFAAIITSISLYFVVTVKGIKNIIQELNKKNYIKNADYYFIFIIFTTIFSFILSILDFILMLVTKTFNNIVFIPVLALINSLLFLCLNIKKVKKIYKILLYLAVAVLFILEIFFIFILTNYYYNNFTS